MEIFRKEVEGKLASYFKKRLGMFDYRNNWMKGDCPNCGKALKFGVNLVNNRTNCFSCDYHPRPLEVIMEVEKLTSKHELVTFLAGIADIEKYEHIIKPREFKELTLPPEFKLLILGKGSMIGELAIKYMEGRGFGAMYLSRKGIGYCSEGKYAGYIILPVYMSGRLIYFTGRRFINLGPKFNNPEVEESGIGKSQMMYNSESLLLYKKVRIVESYINALTLGDTASAAFGKKISNYQISMMLRSPVEELVIILDPDAYLDSLAQAKKLVMHKKVKVIKLPDGKDVNDMGKKETLALEKSASFLSHSDIMKMEIFERQRIIYEKSFE